MNRLLRIVAFIVGGTSAGLGQDRTDEALSRTIAALDAALFDAYNSCQPTAFSKFFADDVEFYHDQTGMTSGVASLVEALKKNICGKVRREHVPGTLQVFPMHGYGALQTGRHRFHPAREGSQATGEARYIHLWRQTNGEWKITRVISYDHGGVDRR